MLYRSNLLGPVASRFTVPIRSYMKEKDLARKPPEEPGDVVSSIFIYKTNIIGVGLLALGCKAHLAD